MDQLRLRLCRSPPASEHRILRMHAKGGESNLQVALSSLCVDHFPGDGRSLSVLHCRSELVHTGLQGFLLFHAASDVPSKDRNPQLHLLQAALTNAELVRASVNLLERCSQHIKSSFQRATTVC